MYTLKALCAKAYQELLESGLKEKTVYGANWYIWNRLVRKYGELAYFKTEMVYEYCIEYFGRNIFLLENSNLLDVEKRYIRAFNKLIQSNNDIIFEKYNKHYYADYCLSERSNTILNEYLINCKEHGNSSRTIDNKYHRIKRFIIDVDFDNITSEKANHYLENLRNRQNDIAYNILVRLIRNFLVFCYENKYINKYILSKWPNNLCSNMNKKIPSVYSCDEIRILLDDSKKYNREDNHLRNYAILSLIVFSGLRVSDVSNLELSNIDWRNNSIIFIQQKNKRKHSIPLIPEIGNALIDYLINERKKGSTYLFTKEDGSKMKPSYITNIINNYFCTSRININGRHYGPHALRHSIATNLINKSIDAFSVANVLGHSNIDCVGIYAKVDLVNLRKCVLEAPYNA